MNLRKQKARLASLLAYANWERCSSLLSIGSQFNRRRYDGVPAVAAAIIWIARTCGSSIVITMQDHHGVRAITTYYCSAMLASHEGFWAAQPYYPLALQALVIEQYKSIRILPCFTRNWISTLEIMLCVLPRIIQKQVQREVTQLNDIVTHCTSSSNWEPRILGCLDHCGTRLSDRG